VVARLFVGDDVECFHQASELSLKVNFQMLDREFRKCVVYLDPSEFKSTWLGTNPFTERAWPWPTRRPIVLRSGRKEFG